MRKKNKSRVNKKKNLIIVCVILAIVAIFAVLMSNKESIKSYYVAAVNKLKGEETTNVGIINPSFEDDSFDETKEVTFNDSLTGWKKTNSDVIIGGKYNPSALVETQYFFELADSAINSLFYNVQLTEDTEYNWSIAHRGRTAGYTDVAAIIIGPKQDIEPSKNSEGTQDQFMKMTTWLKENDNMVKTDIAGISEKHIIYTSKFTANGGFEGETETFSLTPTEECTEKWSVWLVYDIKHCWGEYNAIFNSENMTDAVVAISYFETAGTDKSSGNLIKEFKIYNDNENVLNINAKQVYENNQELLSNLITKGWGNMPAANSTSATIKEGIWSATEASKRLEIGIYNSTKNEYGLTTLSSINASDGDQFILGDNIYQTVTTSSDNEMIKITFDTRNTETKASQIILFVANNTMIPTEDPDTKKNQFDYLKENSIVYNQLENTTYIYTPKFAENGKFVGDIDISQAVSTTKDEIHTEKIYIYQYYNKINTKWTNHEVIIPNTLKELSENLIIYYAKNHLFYKGDYLLDNVQISTTSIKPFEGEGTQQSPYLIQDEEDFVNFRISALEGKTYQNIYFKQTNNITITKPIPIAYNVDFKFYGVYDGNGYYIENMNGIIPFNTLFGTVKNLGIKNINTILAGITHYLQGGTIENCWVTGNIKGSSGAGIANGTGYGTEPKIKNSYFAGTIIATTNLGAASYANSRPIFENVFSTTEQCIIKAPWIEADASPTIINCGSKTEDEMKTQEFLDTLNQYVNENNGLAKWIFDEQTGLPVLTQEIVKKPAIYELSVAGNDANSNILWMYDENTEEYNLYLPKSVDRSNLTINVAYSRPEKEASVYDVNDTKLGTLKSGEVNSYFTNDKIILKFDEENTPTYTINVLQSTLPSVFLNVDGGDVALNEINADRNHDIGYPGTAVINDDSNTTTTAKFKKMKGRGNFTWKCSKRPYQVSFDEKISMLGMPKSKKWLFITNYIEGSLTRSAMFYKLTQELGIQYGITFETADVYINGKYNGTYLVTSKVESGTNRVEITDSDYLMEIDNYTDPIQFVTARTGKKITIKSPDVEDSTAEEQQAVISAAKAYLDSIETLIYDENVTFEELSNKLDMESFAKCYWVYEISINYDAMYGSSYMYTKDGKLYMGPMWDFDNCLNLLSKNATPLDSYYLLGNKGGASSGRLRWYNELMKRQEFSELVDKVFLENIDKFDGLVEYTKQYNQNITASAKMNYTRWPYAKMKQEYPSYYMGGNSFEEASQNLIADITTRVNFYKNEYANLNLSKIKYTVTDENGETISEEMNLSQGTNKIKLPETVAKNATITLEGILPDGTTKNISSMLLNGTNSVGNSVNLTSGTFTGKIQVANEILTTGLDKTVNANYYNLTVEVAQVNQTEVRKQISKMDGLDSSHYTEDTYSEVANANTEAKAIDSSSSGVTIINLLTKIKNKLLALKVK